MLKKFSFWIRGAIVFQLLTAAIHSVSFFTKPIAENEMEKQLFDLLRNYKADLGAGFTRTWSEIFVALSACFTLICLLGGVMNWYFKKKGLSPDFWKGFLLIQLIIYGMLFIIMLKFTFLPPITLTGLVFLFIAGSYFTAKPA